MDSTTELPEFIKVPPDKPSMYFVMAEHASASAEYRRGLRDAALLCRAHDRDLDDPRMACPPGMLGVYLDNLAEGKPL